MTPYNFLAPNKFSVATLRQPYSGRRQAPGRTEGPTISDGPRPVGFGEDAFGVTDARRDLGSREKVEEILRRLPRNEVGAFDGGVGTAEVVDSVRNGLVGIYRQ